MAAGVKSTRLRRISNFGAIWFGDYKLRLQEQRQHLSFGIRRRMLFFIVVLICLAFGIGEMQKKVMLNYVIDREKVDLSDESKNLKLNIELALQTAYAKVISLKPFETKRDPNVETDPNVEIDLTHLESNDQIGKHLITKAKVGKVTSQSELLESFTQLQHFDRDIVLQSPTKLPTQAVWSHLYWESEQSLDETTRKALIQLLLPQSQVKGSPTAAAAATGPPAANSPADELSSKDSNPKYCLISFDITHLVTNLSNGSRQLVYLVGFDRHAPQLWMAPNGPPNHLPSGEPTSVPRSVAEAVVTTQQLFEKLPLHVEHQYLYCPDRTGYWGRLSNLSSDQGVAVASLFDAEDPTRPSSLRFSESNAVALSVFATSPSQTIKSISEDLKTELKAIEKTLRKVDPFARIEQIGPDPLVRFRTRAANAEYLQLANLYVEAFVNAHAAGTKLSWNDVVEMDDFALSVQRIMLPALEAEDRHPASLGYLVRAASLVEIKSAVTNDLKWLDWATKAAIVFAIVSAFFVSYRLINPLIQMTEVAKRVSELGREKSDRIKEKLEPLLNKLPTKHKTELGLLATQFQSMTRDLMAAKQKAELTATNLIAEQRKGEQAGREKAIATEVSEHLVRLLGSVSHDMRQPLVQISFHAEQLYRQSELSEKNRGRLKTVIRNITELDALIEDILDYNRIIKGEINLKLETFDLRELLDEITSHYEEVAKRKAVTLEVSTWWKGSLHSDRLRLKRVLSNLLSNAINATHDGKVSVQVAALGTETIEIAVTDTGAGMNELQQQLVFKFAEDRARIIRQHRSLTTSKDSNSTGLGLHIAKQLVEKLGGSISFTTAEGSGTTFKLQVPLKALDQSQDNQATSSPLLADHQLSSLKPGSAQMTVPANTPSAVPLRAVVVDDDPRCTEILAEMLAELGYYSEQIHDGEQAIEVITDTPPDLVTLDVNMPGTDGWEVLRRLKASRATEDIPVVMVTVHPNESKATLLGANGFVGKPVEQNVLTRSVMYAIGNRPDARVLVVDDEPECLLQMKELLQPLRCHVLLAHDGIKALEEIAEQRLRSPGRVPLDLVIVDLYMDRMDGFELIHKLRDGDDTRDIPIIVLSAGVFSEAERAELLPEVTRFFSKGAVDLATLRGEIARLLRKPASQAITPAEIDHTPV